MKENTPKIASKGTLKLAKSFTAKLSQASLDTKYYYNEIKNNLLFLRGVKTRTSWRYETFSVKKVPVARLSVIGKTLCLFVCVHHSMLDKKYFAEDVSGISKYDGTPSLIRIKSQRGLKYALEIIDLLGIEKRRNYRKHRTDWNVPYRSTERLKEMGLIKTIKK